MTHHEKFKPHTRMWSVRMHDSNHGCLQMATHKRRKNEANFVWIGVLDLQFFKWYFWHGTISVHIFLKKGPSI